MDEIISEKKRRMQLHGMKNENLIELVIELERELRIAKRQNEGNEAGAYNIAYKAEKDIEKLKEQIELYKSGFEFVTENFNAYAPVEVIGTPSNLPKGKPFLKAQELLSGNTPARFDDVCLSRCQ